MQKSGISYIVVTVVAITHNSFNLRVRVWGENTASYLARIVAKGERWAQLLVRRITAKAPKSPNSISSTSFNAVHLLPKDLKFEHGAAKFFLARGAI